VAGALVVEAEGLARGAHGERAAGHLDGLEPADPGVAPVVTWRPDGPVADPYGAYFWAGVARKP